jgi:hypothetical protein
MADTQMSADLFECLGVADAPHAETDAIADVIAGVIAGVIDDVVAEAAEDAAEPAEAAEDAVEPAEAAEDAVEPAEAEDAVPAAAEAAVPTPKAAPPPPPRWPMPAAELSKEMMRLRVALSDSEGKTEADAAYALLPGGNLSSLARHESYYVNAARRKAQLVPVEEVEWKSLRNEVVGGSFDAALRKAMWDWDNAAAKAKSVKEAADAAAAADEAEDEGGSSEESDDESEESDDESEEAAEEAAAAPVAGPVRQKIPCPRCPKLFATAATLKVHLRDGACKGGPTPPKALKVRKPKRKRFSTIQMPRGVKRRGTCDLNLKYITPEVLAAAMRGGRSGILRLFPLIYFNLAHPENMVYDMVNIGQSDALRYRPSLKIWEEKTIAFCVDEMVEDVAALLRATWDENTPSGILIQQCAGQRVVLDILNERTSNYKFFATVRSNWTKHWKDGVRF